MNGELILKGGESLELECAYFARALGVKSLTYYLSREDAMALISEVWEWLNDEPVPHEDVSA